MIDPVTAQLILAGVQMAGGAIMAKNNKRPTYQTPSAVTNMVNIAENLAAESVMPGMDLATSEIDRATANYASRAMMSAVSPSEAGQMVSLGYNNDLASKRSLSVENARYKQANQLRLMQVKQMLAAYEDKAFDLNKLQPYLDKARASSALIGSGIQNAFGAMNTAQQTKDNQAYLDAVIGTDGRTPVPKKIEYLPVLPPRNPVEEELLKSSTIMDRLPYTLDWQSNTTNPMADE